MDNTSESRAGLTSMAASTCPTSQACSALGNAGIRSVSLGPALAGAAAARLSSQARRRAGSAVSDKRRTTSAPTRSLRMMSICVDKAVMTAGCQPVDTDMGSGRPWSTITLAVAT